MEQNNGSIAKQRIHRSEEEILKHLTDQEESEFSVKEYCEMFDINEQTFNSWIKKHRKGNEENGFTTIEIIPSDGAKPVLFAEITKENIRLYKEVPADFLKSLLS